jgi:hypothetical protein
MSRVFISTGQRSSEDTVQSRGVGEFLQRYHFCILLYKIKNILFGGSDVSNLSSHSFLHISKIVLHVDAKDNIVPVRLSFSNVCISSSSGTVYVL